MSNKLYIAISKKYINKVQHLLKSNLGVLIKGIAAHVSIM